ncbi:MAG: hypothetical protein ACJAUH_000637 [Saprospiraceae bacterium]|jgi:hypothetical protein
MFQHYLLTIKSANPYDCCIIYWEQLILVTIFRYNPLISKFIGRMKR